MFGGVPHGHRGANMVTEKAKKDRKDAYWKVMSTIIVPIIFIALIPVGFSLFFVQNQSIVRDRKATALALRATATALWSRYDNDVAGCYRGNVVRSHVTNLDASLVATNQLLGSFFDTSAQFRMASGEDKLAVQSLKAREAIRLIASGIEPIAQVNCLVVIKKPSVPRPKERS